MVSVPMLAKGILTGAGALRCIAIGFDGVIVSNHGGRALDYGPSPLEVPAEVVDAVGGRVPELIDSGFRRSRDVAKALAIGADGVWGRVLRWGLGAFGVPGAQRGRWCRPSWCRPWRPSASPRWPLSIAAPSGRTSRRRHAVRPQSIAVAGRRPGFHAAGVQRRAVAPERRTGQRTGVRGIGAGDAAGRGILEAGRRKPGAVRAVDVPPEADGQCRTAGPVHRSGAACPPTEGEFCWSGQRLFAPIW